MLYLLLFSCTWALSCHSSSFGNVHFIHSQKQPLTALRDLSLLEHWLSSYDIFVGSVVEAFTNKRGFVLQVASQL